MAALVHRRKLSRLGEKATGVPENRVWGMPLPELLGAVQRIEEKHNRHRIWLEESKPRRARAFHREQAGLELETAAVAAEGAVGVDL